MNFKRAAVPASSRLDRPTGIAGLLRPEVFARGNSVSSRATVPGLSTWVGIVTICVTLAACGKPSEAEQLAAARANLDKNDNRAAVVQLKDLLQSNGQSADARYLLGRALFEQGDAEAAVLELNKARELRYSDDVVVPLLVQAMLAAGQNGEVVSKFSSLNLTTPAAQADLLAGRAAAHVRLGQMAAADADVASALALVPAQRVARLLKARRLAGQGDTAAAMAVAEALSAEDPKDLRALLLRAELEWASRGNSDVAVKLLESALALAPADVRAHTLLVQIELGRNDAAAIQRRVDALVAAAPKSVEAVYFRTRLALLRNDLTAAKTGAQQLLRLAPGYGPALLLAGTVELRTGDREFAIRHLAEAVAALPGQVEPRRLLAEAQMQVGQYDRALLTTDSTVERSARRRTRPATRSGSSFRTGRNRPGNRALRARRER